jgi:hypothetical protein
MDDWQDPGLVTGSWKEFTTGVNDEEANRKIR